MKRTIIVCALALIGMTYAYRAGYRDAKRRQSDGQFMITRESNSVPSDEWR